MTALNGPFYIVLMKTSDHVAVLANRDDNTIAAKQHSHEWMQHFEEMYNRAHRRSYEGSMSACINNIMMQPSIVQVQDLDDIEQRVLDVETAQVKSFWGTAGGFTGITSKTELQDVWSSGAKPRLISV